MINNMAVGVGYSMQCHCCVCGGKFIIPDYAGDASFGMESVKCPHCGIVGHRVKSCRR